MDAYEARNGGWTLWKFSIIHNVCNIQYVSNCVGFETWNFQVRNVCKRSFQFPTLIKQINNWKGLAVLYDTFHQGFFPNWLKRTPWQYSQKFIFGDREHGLNSMEKWYIICYLYLIGIKMYSMLQPVKIFAISFGDTCGFTRVVWLISVFPLFDHSNQPLTFAAAFCGKVLFIIKIINSIHFRWKSSDFFGLYGQVYCATTLALVTDSWKLISIPVWNHWNVWSFGKIS